MSKVFLIADTHWGHRNILKYRSGFRSVEEHDETIIQNWNRVVTKAKFQVWVLGDMCIQNKLYDMDSIINRLHGTIHVIPGNHCHLPYYASPRIDLRRGLEKKYGFWLSHVPIHPNELRGKRNIHGHVHRETINDDRYINVCCEAIGYTPIDVEQIRERFRGI